MRFTKCSGKGCGAEIELPRGEAPTHGWCQQCYNKALNVENLIRQAEGVKNAKRT